MNRISDSGAHQDGDTRTVAKLSLGAILLILAGLGVMALSDKPQTAPIVHSAALDHSG